MAIDTTLRIHIRTIELLESAVSRTGNTRTEIIIMLLNRVMADRRNKPVTGSAIRYQQRDYSEMWRTVHVRLREDEIDYFKDVRGFLKLSVSYILALAAREYLTELIEDFRKNGKCDNYLFSNYLLVRNVVDGLFHWHICWGFPEKPENYIRFLHQQT